MPTPRVQPIALKLLSEVGDDIITLLHYAQRIPDLIHDIELYQARIKELEEQLNSQSSNK